MLLEKVQSIINNCVDSWLECPVSDLNLSITIETPDNTTDLLVCICADFPCLPLEFSLRPIVQKSLNAALPHYQITVLIKAQIKSHSTQLVGKSLRAIKNTIAIASGKGGVGKSSVAVNLATALERAGARVGILDADIYGPSIPLLLGAHDAVKIENGKYLPVCAHGLQAMSIGYLGAADEALIWRGPMLAKSLLQMIDSTLWHDLDYLLIDLPPGTGDIQLSLVQKIPLTAAIVVTTPQTVATMDAQKALHMFAKTNIDVLGIIENMSTHTCSSCGNTDTLFGSGGGASLSSAFATPILGHLPLDKAIGIQSDAGVPIATQNNATAALFMKIALKAGVYLSKKPRNYSHSMPSVKVEL